MKFKKQYRSLKENYIIFFLLMRQYWRPRENSSYTWCRSTCYYFGCTRASPQAGRENRFEYSWFEVEKYQMHRIFFPSNRHKQSGKIWAVRQKIQFLTISLLYLQDETINETNFCINALESKKNSLPQSLVLAFIFFYLSTGVMKGFLKQLFSVLFFRNYSKQ